MMLVGDLLGVAGLETRESPGTNTFLTHHTDPALMYQSMIFLH